MTGAHYGSLLKDDREDTIDRGGREVSTLGSRNTLRLRGSCPILIVTGSDNEFSADTTQRIRTTRGRNRVVWTSELDDDATRRKHGSAEPHQKTDRKPVSP